MTIPRKQLKITKMFKRGATKIPEERDELLEEVQQLEQRLREKQNELFQIQRNSYRRKPSPVKKKEEKEDFVRPERIILNNSIASLKKNIELHSILTSTEVQSYVAGEHCCVVFHMQHPSEHVVSHGIRIDMDSGRNEISSMSLPLGFDLSSIMEDYENVMKPECLGAIRKGLVAYHDRLDQFTKLKNLVNVEAELFKSLDGSYVEISLFVSGDEEEYVPVTLKLEYRLYDIRPKNYSIKDTKDLPKAVAEGLKAQCAVFKEKPLHKAFKQAFLGDAAQYTLVLQMGTREKAASPPAKRFRPNGQRYHDDTFRPDECSDQGEDDEDLE